DRVAALAFLEHAARNRRQWLRNYYRVNKRIVERDKEPRAYLNPEQQHDPITAYEPLETLHAGALEIETAQAPLVADDARYPACSSQPEIMSRLCWRSRNTPICASTRAARQPRPTTSPATPWGSRWACEWSRSSASSKPRRSRTSLTWRRP